MPYFPRTAALLAAFALAACSGSSGSQTAQAAASDSAADQGTVYQVAVDATYPPFEFRDEAGKFIGMEIDLLNAIAADQGFRVNYYHHDWDGIFGELEEKRADIIAAAVTPDEESLKAADLSKHYYTSPYSVVALNAGSLTGNNWHKLKIGVATNEDVQNDLTEKLGIPADRFVRYPTQYLALVGLTGGEVGAVAGDASVLRFYMGSPVFSAQSRQFVSQNLVNQTPASDNLSFAVRKGNQELLDKINAGLDNLRQDGRFEQIMGKWRQHTAS